MKKNRINIIFVCVFAAFISFSSVAAQKYLSIHDRAVVADLHSDVLLNVLRGADISKRLDFGQVDLVRLKEGGVDIEFFAVWPDPKRYRPGGMFRQSLRMIDSLDALIARHPDKIMLTRSTAEIETALRSGKLAACIGVEGGTAIENDLAKLDSLYNRGARYLSLTWNDSPDWASSAKDENSGKFERVPGLSAFGREVIARMNQLGMIVDISHSGEKTFYDALASSKHPLIASHSCAYHLRWHSRNLKDAQIKALAAKGGVLFINFYPGYLDHRFEKAYSRVRKNEKTYLDSMRTVYGNNHLEFRRFRTRYLRNKVESDIPDVKRVVAHIEHVIELVGDDHVGLGSDYDGISITPRGLEDVSKMPNITRVLLQRGHSEERIRKILGGNFMRVFGEVTR